MAPQAKTDEWWSSPAACSSKTSAFLDLLDQGLEHGIDFLGSCDADAGHKSQPVPANKELLSFDYARFHDEFLEALLQEQTAKAAAEGGRSSPSTITTNTTGEASESNPTRPTFRRQASSMPFEFSNASLPEEQPLTPRRVEINQGSDSKSSAKARRRRFISSSSRPQKRQVVDISVLEQTPSFDSFQSREIDDSLSKVSILSELSHKNLPEPCTYMHSKCKLQKDKGAGETLGTAVCADNREACLEKLRQKMELLTQVAMGGNVSDNDSQQQTLRKSNKTANMKRKKAKIVSQTAAYTETRSVIKLKMGFLSLQYGVLLRWDTKSTGKILFVVLRKMCDASFYASQLQTPYALQHQDSSLTCHTATMLEKESRAYVLRSVVEGNNAVLQRSDACEVTLVEPPFLVKRPETFDPSLLQVVGMRVEGLDSKQSWMVNLVLEEAPQKARLLYQPNEGCFVQADDNQVLEWDLGEQGVLDLSLQVQIYQVTRRPQKRKRLVSTLSVGLNHLLTLGPTANRLVTVACPQDPSVVVQLQIQHSAPHVHWLHRELEARRKLQEKKSYWSTVGVQRSMVHQEEEENNDPDLLWNICCAW